VQSAGEQQKAQHSVEERLTKVHVSYGRGCPSVERETEALANDAQERERQRYGHNTDRQWEAQESVIEVGGDSGYCEQQGD